MSITPDGAGVPGRAAGRLPPALPWSDGGATDRGDGGRRRSPSGTSTWCSPTTRPRLTIAHGLDESGSREQLDQIDQVNADIAAVGPFRILTGIEVDILEDGPLDLADEMFDASTSSSRASTRSCGWTPRR